MKRRYIVKKVNNSSISVKVTPPFNNPLNLNLFLAGSPCKKKSKPKPTQKDLTPKQKKQKNFA